MGCAEETLTDILTYLHREYMNPNYLEEYFLLEQHIDTDLEADQKSEEEYKFHMNKLLDNAGCTPKCAAHLSFGMDFCEISKCNSCDIADDVGDVKRELCHTLYVEEMFSTVEILQTKGGKRDRSKIQLPEIINHILKGETDFHMQYRDISIC